MDQSEIDAMLNNMGDKEEPTQSEEKLSSEELSDNEIHTASESENIDTDKDMEDPLELDELSEEIDTTGDNEEDDVETMVITTPVSDIPDSEGPALDTEIPLDTDGDKSITVEDIKRKVEGAIHSLSDLNTLLVDLDILNRISKLTEALAQGKVYQEIDIEVKGALGNLFLNLKQTMLNLQQLDTSVKKESQKVPELAEQLDSITKETETATQKMLSQIDTVLADADDVTGAFNNVVAAFKDFHSMEKENAEMIRSIIELIDNNASDEQVASAAVEFAYYMKEINYLEKVDGLGTALENCHPVSDKLGDLQNSAFDIMNELQFQDITRQKIEKIIQLLKNLQLGLKKLLVIFKMDVTDEFEVIDDSKISKTTQDNIFSVKTEADYKKHDVEDIISEFKNTSEQKDD